MILAQFFSPLVAKEASLTGLWESRRLLGPEIQGTILLRTIEGIFGNTSPYLVARDLLLLSA